jgi:lipopolysaccharide biosynthesis glycosyltransferase
MDDGRRRARTIARLVDGQRSATVVGLAGRLIAYGQRETAAELVAAIRAVEPLDLDEPHTAALAWIEERLSPVAPAIAPDAVPVAVLDGRTPDPGLPDAGLGDGIEALAALAQLARLEGIEVSGEDGLGDLVVELRDRVPAADRLAAGAGRLHVVALDRDLPSLRAVPDGTWVIACGMHWRRPFDHRLDAPYPDHVRPIFVSFQLASPDVLTEAAIDQLRRWGPIGCRDWDTVDLLLGAGVDAFFTGCLTTTVGALYPARTAGKARRVVGVIDGPATAAGRGVRQVRSIVDEGSGARDRTLADRARRADSVLAAAGGDLDRAVTTRLRPYLALTALGIPTTFRPRWRGEEGLAGLTELQPSDPRLVAMQERLRSLLGAVLAGIASGLPDVEVSARWRAATQPLVDEARDRCAAPAPEPRTTMDLPAVVASIRAERRSFGDERADRGHPTDVVLSFDQNLTLPAAVLLESAVAHAAGPLRLWVLGRGLPARYPDWLAAAFPAIPMTFFPCDRVSYGATGRPRRMTSRITVSTMDRLLLPDLLRDISRVVYLDVDTLLLDDVGTLASLDLAGRPLAARDSNVSESSEWIRASRGLEASLAVELRRRMAHRHGVGHAALNAGVLVLDLDRMRQDDFATTYLGLVERYGFHDQDTLLAYVGPDRVVIDPAWNAMPVLEDVPDPRLIHWASFGKPWEPYLTEHRDRWQAFAASLRARAGDPPTT